MKIEDIYYILKWNVDDAWPHKSQSVPSEIFHYTCAFRQTGRNEIDIYRLLMFHFVPMAESYNTACVAPILFP